MPWREELPMDQRLRFIGDYLNGYFSFAELCDRFGISRKTGYKWINRYRESGNPTSIVDQSRRPHHFPTKTPEVITEALLSIRDKHPSWGPRKLLWRVARDHPEWINLPAPSTVSLILKRNGLSRKRRKSVRRPHPGKPMTVITEANQVWTLDFKGQFKTGDGVYCYPLTVADGFSRYIFGCEGLLSPSHDRVKRSLKRIFKEHGLPERIRSDNGTPFASVALGRLSRLSVWWIRLGILPELIEPGCPQQNGRHERMHKTLKYETTIPPAENLRKQQRKFDSFRYEFNYERPHEALDMTVPSEVHTKSSRPYPAKLPQVEYPAHFEVRRVSHNSGFRWRSKRVNAGHVFSGEYIGLEEIDNGIWDVYFGPIWLGRLDERIMQIEDKYGRLERKPHRAKV